MSRWAGAKARLLFLLVISAAGALASAFMFSIYLVQAGVTSSHHSVSGKSGKLYGVAQYDARWNGVALPMSISDYMAAASDLIGNLAPGQQWVPHLVPAGTETAQPKPVATAAPVAVRVVTSSEERLTPPIADKRASDVELPPERMAAPAIGTDREIPAGERQTTGQVPPKPSNYVEKTPERVVGTVREFYPTGEAPPKPAPKSVPVLTESVDHKQHQSQKRKRGPHQLSEFNLLQMRVSRLGINVRGMNKAQLEQVIERDKNAVPFSD